MKNKYFVALMMCCFACISYIPCTAQNFIGSNSVLELSPMGDRIGLSLEPKTAIEDTILNLKGGDQFTISAGTITGGSNFSGKVAVALVRNGALVEILAEQNLGVSGNTTLFFNCKISESTQVNEGDIIRLVSSAGNGMYQAINSTYGGIVTQIPATGYKIPFHKINIPETIPGITITQGESVLYRDKIVRGRNYAFYITPDNANLKIIVEANGQPLSETYGYYALNNVLGDIDVSIRVFNPDTAVTYQKIEVSDSVRITDILSQTEMDCVSFLVISGDMKDEDIYTIRDHMPTLETLDLSQANVENNYMPEYALNYRSSIKKLFLPLSVEGFGSDAFRGMTGLTSIVLPEKLCVFGYNQFFGCSNLKTVWVKWDPSKNGSTTGFPIPPCAFRSTPYSYDGTLIVPKGSLNAYKMTSVWGDFATIREEYPVDKLVLGTDDEALSENVGIEIFTDGKSCIVKQSSERQIPIAIYSIGGEQVYRRTLYDTRTAIELAPGFYIVVSGEKRQKIVIR
ncbi:MAG: leucine-rich repeat protein [Coprobacter sp.]|nr:leucine-rich repeat protein [Coprobacter sp.]